MARLSKKTIEEMNALKKTIENLQTKLEEKRVEKVNLENAIWTTIEKLVKSEIADQIDIKLDDVKTDIEDSVEDKIRDMIEGASIQV